MDPVFGLLGGELHKLEREIRLARAQRRAEWFAARVADAHLPRRRAFAAWTGGQLVRAGEALRGWGAPAPQGGIREHRTG